MERIERSDCPVCESNKAFAPRFEMERTGERFRIVNCTDCGFVFVADPPADTANHGELEKLYWRFRARHHQIRRLLLRHLRRGQKVLEIGCGRGELGYIMRNDPFQYVGYEPARGLSDFGIAEGVNIVQAPFHGSVPADAVVIDNVLEHVMEPRQLIKTAASVLNPGGLLIVITPNLNDVRTLYPAWRKRYLWIPPDHINYFSATDIEHLFASVQMQPKRFRFGPLTTSDWKYLPRALAESVGMSVFGHNVYAVAR